MTTVMITLEDYARLIEERNDLADALVSIFLRYARDSEIKPSSPAFRIIDREMEWLYEKHQDVLDAAFDRYGEEDES